MHYMLQVQKREGRLKPVANNSPVLMFCVKINNFDLLELKLDQSVVDWNFLIGSVSRGL